MLDLLLGLLLELFTTSTRRMIIVILTLLVLKYFHRLL